MQAPAVADRRRRRSPPPLARPFCSSRSTRRAPTRSALTPPASRRPRSTALVARGRRFLQAYATVPETLPSHTSMMTGLYPAGHGLHENARYVPADRPVLAERLQQAGYRTAAFVSSFALARRFGLARGFDRVRRRASGRTSRALLEGHDRRGTQRARRADRRSRCFSGCTTTIRTRRTRRPSRTARSTRPRRTSARWRRWTSSSDGLIQAFDRAVHRTVGDRRRRRSRRRARRSRRSAARNAALSVDDARAARGDRAGSRAPASRPRRSARDASSTRSSTGPASTRRTACSSRRPDVVLAKR